MQSTTNSECIPTLEFPEIPNKDEFVVSDVSSIFRTYTKSKLIVLPKLIRDFYATRLYRVVLKKILFRIKQRLVAFQLRRKQIITSDKYYMII